MGNKGLWRGHISINTSKPVEMLEITDSGQYKLAPCGRILESLHRFYQLSRPIFWQVAFSILTNNKCFYSAISYSFKELKKYISITE